MIDPATIRIVIENLRNHGFTTAQEKLLAVVLAHVSEIQQCEIIEILELSEPHSRHTLKEFVEKKLIDSFGRRDVFYRPTGFNMVEKMPERMDLWEQYRDLRKEDTVKAKMFYKQNRTEMREGAIVAWEANHTDNELDALQHAMNIWADSEVTFASEFQNEPMKPDQGEMVVPAKVIRTRLNGLDHQTLPLDAPTLTGFIDVHDDLLYYSDGDQNVSANSYLTLSFDVSSNDKSSLIL